MLSSSGSGRQDQPRFAPVEVVAALGEIDAAAPAAVRRTGGCVPGWMAAQFGGMERPRPRRQAHPGMTGEQQVGAGAGIECGLRRISNAGSGPTDRGTVVAHGPANAVRRIAHADMRARLVAGHGISRRHHDVESLVAPAGILLERVVEDREAPDAAVGLAAQDDVGVVALLVDEAERRFDPLEAVVRVGVANAKATVGPVDKRPAVARQPLAIHVEVGIGAVEPIRLRVSPQAPVDTGEVRHVFPGTVALDEGASVDAYRSMQAARDVLHLFDQAVVEEVLGRVADDQLGGVELAHAWSRLGVLTTDL